MGVSADCTSNDCCSDANRDKYTVSITPRTMTGIAGQGQRNHRVQHQYSDFYNDQMEDMHVEEFERRVKQFAFPENRGYINVEQLKEAFKDTNVFTNLGNKTTI